ncbi:MAG: HigA family addiction module antitoxin [Candidatus Sulfotelmatobacter sp.]
MTEAGKSGTKKRRSEKKQSGEDRHVRQTDTCLLRGRKGRRAVTGDTALRLAHFFGTTAEFWLNLQSLYEIRMAQQKAGKSIRVLPRLRRLERARA